MHCILFEYSKNTVSSNLWCRCMCSPKRTHKIRNTMHDLQQEHVNNHGYIYFPISSSTFSSGEQSILHTRRFGSKSCDGHKSQLITHLTTVAIYVQISSADLATIKDWCKWPIQHYAPWQRINFSSFNNEIMCSRLAFIGTHEGKSLTDNTLLQHAL